MFLVLCIIVAASITTYWLMIRTARRDRVVTREDKTAAEAAIDLWLELDATPIDERAPAFAETFSQERLIAASYGLVRDQQKQRRKYQARETFGRNPAGEELALQQQDDELDALLQTLENAAHLHAASHEPTTPTENTGITR